MRRTPVPSGSRGCSAHWAWAAIFHAKTAALQPLTPSMVRFFVKGCPKGPSIFSCAGSEHDSPARATKATFKLKHCSRIQTLKHQKPALFDLVSGQRLWRFDVGSPSALLGAYAIYFNNLPVLLRRSASTRMCRRTRVLFSSTTQFTIGSQ